MSEAKKSKVSKEDKEKCRVLTPEFRVAYPHVFKPQAMKNSKPKYSVTMLFSKDTDLAELKAAMKQAKILKFGPKENWPDDLESPVLDGDNTKFADREGYKGCWVIKATSSEEQKPGVVGEDAKPIIEQGKFYPGCYARASLWAYVWDNEFGKGVGLTLDGVQKLREGKSFGGRKPMDQVFAPVKVAETTEENYEEESF